MDHQYLKLVFIEGFFD